MQPNFADLHPTLTFASVGSTLSCRIKQQQQPVLTPRNRRKTVYGTGAIDRCGRSLPAEWSRWPRCQRCCDHASSSYCCRRTLRSWIQRTLSVPLAPRRPAQAYSNKPRAHSASPAQNCDVTGASFHCRRNLPVECSRWPPCQRHLDHVSFSDCWG